MEVNCCNFFD